MNRTLKNTLSASTVGVLLILSNHAHAGGFIADTFVKPFSPALAKKLDDTNKKTGQLIDHAANAIAGTAANAVVPGSGPVVTGALEARMAIRQK